MISFIMFPLNLNIELNNNGTITGSNQRASLTTAFRQIDKDAAAPQVI